jgi:uncharacterized membrane protein YgdD (TMEM256/DUF423 family)
MVGSLFLLLGALSAMTGVGMGAFGAHALKKTLSSDMLAVYQTAVAYQMWHALGLIAIALYLRQTPGSYWLQYAGWAMFAGIVTFSGSLYLLILFNKPQLGLITPLGGVCFLGAWLLVAIYAFQLCRG